MTQIFLPEGPNQVENLWKLQGVGGEDVTSTPWNGNSKGVEDLKQKWGGGLDSFWNYTIL